MIDACALCGLPVKLGSVTPDGLLLHHGGELSQIIGWTHGDECRPIRSSCFRAWTVHGYRPPEKPCIDHLCEGWQPCMRCGAAAACAYDVCDDCDEAMAGE